MSAAWPTSNGPSGGELLAGRYRVEGTLGSGGMSHVLAARSETTGMDVAIKVLRVDGRVHLERFLREAEMLASLVSDHIVRIIEVGAIDDRHPFLVMERLRGRDLGARLRSEGPLPLVVVADAAVQACEALAHAHAASIVHRDIKPSNLFEHETAPGEVLVKLLDFGISKRTDGDESTLTLTVENGAVLGSPPYMSPEHIRDPRKVDGRSDLWSLGAVMYRLLSGKHPFEGATLSELVAAIRERPYVSLRTVGALVPPEIDAVIARCLAKPREERYATASELARALAPFAAPRWAELAMRIDAVGTRHHAISDDPDTVTVSPPEAPGSDSAALGAVLHADAAGELALDHDAPAPRGRERRFGPTVLALALVCGIVPAGFFAVRLASPPTVAVSPAPVVPPDTRTESAPTSSPAADATATSSGVPLAPASALLPATAAASSSSPHAFELAASASVPHPTTSRPPATPRRAVPTAPRKTQPPAKAHPAGRPELYPSPYREE